MAQTQSMQKTKATKSMCIWHWIYSDIKHTIVFGWPRRKQIKSMREIERYGDIINDNVK